MRARAPTQAVAFVTDDVGNANAKPKPNVKGLQREREGAATSYFVVRRICYARAHIKRGRERVAHASPFLLALSRNPGLFTCGEASRSMADTDTIARDGGGVVLNFC